MEVETNHTTLTQKELESPVKGYQLLEVQNKLANMTTVLEDIKNNTKGVISFDSMKSYVDIRIDEKTQYLKDFKNSTTKLGWALLLLVIGDIATRILS